MQAQPRLAVFADDMCLVNVLTLKQRDQSFDAGIPLVRDVRQHERQIEYQFVSGHRYQLPLRKSKPASTEKPDGGCFMQIEPLRGRSRLVVKRLGRPVAVDQCGVTAVM